MMYEAREPTMERTFAALPESLAVIRAFVDGLARRLEIPDEARQELVLAVSEACANGIMHTVSRHIYVATGIVLDDMRVSVRDEGSFRWGPRPGGGWGLPLMRSLTDSLEIREGTPERNGTTVTLAKRIRPWRERAALREDRARRNRALADRIGKYCKTTREMARKEAATWLRLDPRGAPLRRQA
jgi:serine/threonine-protein kinase RsbW